MNRVLCLCLVLVHLQSTIGTHRHGKPDWFGNAQRDLYESANRNLNTNKAKNVILFVGDGMGMSTVTAARILRGQLNGNSGEENMLEFEKFPHIGLSKVYSSDRQTPDSAATATALLCGVKTNSQLIGVDDSAVVGNCSSQFGAEINCMNDWFEEQGRSMGIVTNTKITHATPAAGYAHAASRLWEGDVHMHGVQGGCKDIAHQLIYNNSNIQVLFGGGRQYFIRNRQQDPQYGDAYISFQRQDDLDLIEIWGRDKKWRGYTPKYAWNKQQFDAINPDETDFALGLFNPQHMQYDLERDTGPNGEPSLAEMTDKAIRILSHNTRGYFLMVEGGRIDHGHHNNTAKRALYETLAFEDAVKTALQMTNSSDTLIVVTADHSHVFNIGGHSYRGNNILGVVNPIAPEELPVDGNAWTTLSYGNGPGYDWGFRKDPNTVDTTHNDYRQVSAVPLLYETHSAEDVPVYATGPMAHLFDGVHEQHYIAHALAYAACVGINRQHCNGLSQNKPIFTPMT